MPDYANIRREFPDFPLDSIPEGIPNWLQSAAWHNDAMPIWGDDRYMEGGENGIMLCVDYPDPADRENGSDLPRFYVGRVTDGQNTGPGVLTDDWDEALAELRRLVDLPC